MSLVIGFLSRRKGPRPDGPGSGGQRDRTNPERERDPVGVSRSLSPRLQFAVFFLCVSPLMYFYFFFIVFSFIVCVFFYLCLSSDVFFIFFIVFSLFLGVWMETFVFQASPPACSSSRVLRPPPPTTPVRRYTP